MGPDPELIGQITGALPVDVRAMAGGDIGQVFRLDLLDGRTLIAKLPRPGAADTARNEAMMLGLLADAGVPVPQVVAVQPRLLLLSWVDHDRGSQGAWVDLARVLACLHDTTAEAFGLGDPTYFAGVLQENDWLESWPAFLAERRLLPMTSRAVDSGHLPPATAKRVERLCTRLGDHLPDRPQASLVHGDLWSGNVLFSGNRLAALIDPAVHYAHAEVDLAMLQLFGSPPAAFWQTYQSLRPPEAGASERTGLYQLFPLLFHVSAFGAGYCASVEAILTDLGV